jgi:dihydrofolate reductase
MTSTSNNSNQEEPTMPPTKTSLTLIVATTPSLGIGNKGTLPWPALKSEMGYFARVTKRPPVGSPKVKNAVIMGRKTWESIPPRFRPLKERVNVVVSRNPGFAIQSDASEAKESGVGDDVFVVESLEEAIRRLNEVSKQNGASYDSAASGNFESASSVGKVFVIGGSSIYAEALKMRETDRILMTKIRKEYECDTTFPVDVEGEEGKEEGWEQCEEREWSEFTGEPIGGNLKEDSGVEFEFLMFEKKRIVE